MVIIILQIVDYTKDSLIYKVKYTLVRGHAVAQLVEALRYKSEGRGFDSRWSHCDDIAHGVQLGRPET